MWWNIVTGEHVWCGNARHLLILDFPPLLDAPAPALALSLSLPPHSVRAPTVHSAWIGWPCVSCSLCSPMPYIYDMKMSAQGTRFSKGIKFYEMNDGLWRQADSGLKGSWKGCFCRLVFDHCLVSSELMALPFWSLLFVFPILWSSRLFFRVLVWGGGCWRGD